MHQEGFVVYIFDDYISNFSDYEELQLTDVEAQTLRELNTKALEENVEYGAGIINGSPTALFTSGEQNQIHIPGQLLHTNGVKLFHSHTNPTPLSLADLRILTNPNIKEIGVITINGDVYTVSTNENIIELAEFEAASRIIRREVDFGLMGDYSEFFDWTVAQRQYMAIKEQAYRIARHFEWEMRGGRL